MEDDLDGLEAADPFDDELDDIDKSVELAAQAAADIELRVHKTAAAEIGSVYGRKNLVCVQGRVGFGESHRPHLWLTLATSH